MNARYTTEGRRKGNFLRSKELAEREKYPRKGKRRRKREGRKERRKVRKKDRGRKE